MNYPISDKERKILEELGATEKLQELTIDSFEQPEGDIDQTIEEGQYSTSQAIELAGQNVNFLAGIAMPLVFKFLFPPVLLGVWTLLTREVFKVRTFSQIALGIPRGHAKTTFIKIFVLFCILFTQRRFILIIGRTGPLAQNILADIVGMLDERNIVWLFKSWRLDVSKDTQELKKFTYRGRTIILAALGAGGSVRGLNVDNARPDVMIFEDIQDADDAESEVISKQLERWMYGTAMKAKSPSGCLTIFIGNMFPTKHSILRKIKSNPKWIKFISGAILVDGTALWEELRPLDELLDEFENDTAAGHPEIFLSEVMNDTESNLTASVDVSKIVPWRWNDNELCQGKMIIIDPATGKKGSDPCTIGQFEIFDGVPGLRRLEEGNYSPGQTISRSLILALQTGTKLIVVESVAYQATLLYWFEKTCAELGITGLHFVPIHSTAVAKNSRITEMLRGLVANEQALHPDVKSRVIKQVVEWKPLRRDNDDGILDILTYAPKVLHEYQGLMLSQEEIIINEADSPEVIEHAWAF